MKTTQVLEELRKQNVRIPSSWAIMQSSSGNFLGFMQPGPTKEEVLANCKAFREVISERIRAEREAVKNSTLTEL